MMFQKNIDGSMKWLKEKGKALDNAAGDLNERNMEQNGSELETKDIIAIILSALMVFGPLILVLFLIAILMYI